MKIKGKVKDNMKEGQETLINTAIEPYCIVELPNSHYNTIFKKSNRRENV
jgi:hypothetical protein